MALRAAESPALRSCFPAVCAGGGGRDGGGWLTAPMAPSQVTSCPGADTQHSTGTELSSMGGTGRGRDTEAVGEENPPQNSLHAGSSPPGDPPAHCGPHATTPPPLSAECLLFQKYRVSHEGDPVGIVTLPSLLMLCLGRMKPLDWAMGPCVERGGGPIQVGAWLRDGNTGAKCRAWRPGQQ